MSPSLRCRLSGHDSDPCGVCRRCGATEEPRHTWKEVDRERPCYRLTECEVCGKRHESPDHDWEPTGAATVQGVEIRCSRCGVKI